jgi:hypothetical protein
MPAMDAKSPPSDHPAPPCHATPSQERTHHWLWAKAPQASSRDEDASAWGGKWLWFPPLSTLDRSWGIICTATEDGVLGCQSKVGTLINARQGSDDTRRPICIYTDDWRDLEEVQRVLSSLRSLGIPDALMYKTNDDTRRGRYGKGASTYVAPASKNALVIPEHTRVALERHHTARREARRAAERRKTTMT